LGFQTRRPRLGLAMPLRPLVPISVCLLLVPSYAKDCCWCDDDTPSSASTIVDSEGKRHTLVFSDEFNQPGRDFANGKDAKWTALEIGDTSNKGAAFYLPEQATITTDTSVKGAPVSALLITTENSSHTGDSPTGEHNVFMPYKSAMLQSWNKFCFTGGVVEFSAKQPQGAGYWPALWLFGNLGRAVYQNSNTGLWPWSYSECDDDLILPPEDPPQRISACDDHDLAKDGLHPFQGRGATELDVLEGAVTNDGLQSYVVGSLQLSPGLPAYFKPPLFGFPTTSGAGSWYTGLTFGHGGTDQTDGYANNGWYGPPWGADCPTGCPDALSGGFVNLDDLHTRYWTYRMEWKVGPAGHLSWWYDGNFVWGMDGASFGAYSVCSEKAGEEKACKRTPPRMIPNEPMSLVMNTAIGTWNGGKSALDGKHWPARFYIDYVRVWQVADEMNVGCNPPDYPTKVYIDNHHEWYGEPAEPSGYDTCPEIYPASSHAQAKLFAVRADEKRIAKAAGTLSSFKSNAAAPTLPATTLASIGSGASAQAADAPASPSSTSSSLVTMLGVAVLSAVLGAFITQRAMRLQRPPLGSFGEIDRAYEEFAAPQRYGPINLG